MLRIFLSAGRLAVRHGMTEKAALEESSRGWPLPNIWLGMSAGMQRTLDERYPDLVATKAAVRFISFEPLLEELDAGTWFQSSMNDTEKCAIDQGIIGGESGPGARENRLRWMRKLVHQCRAAGVAPYVKQTGANCLHDDGTRYVVKGKGDRLDDLPLDLRYREMPA